MTPMRLTSRILLLLAGAAAGFQVPAGAETRVLYVAPRETPAFAAAERLGGPVQPSLHRALDQAAEAVNQPGPQTVTVMVAAGEYDGKAGQGTWPIPRLTNPQGSLRLVGGFGDDYSSRQPFTRLTKLVTSSGRPGAILSFAPRSQVREIVISGFHVDGALSNAYDEETNSFLRAGSRSFPVIAFNQLVTDRVVIADNLFLNGGHGVLDPLIAAASPETVVEIRNNLFLNNIKTMQVGAGSGLPYRGNTVKTVRLVQNTFLLNWPYNPEPTSSNVSAVTLHHRGTAQEIHVEGNLFAYNLGGAMQHDWQESRMPKLTLRNNLFYKNGLLFGKQEPGAGVFAGKFGLNPKYLVLDAARIADDFSYQVEGNVTLDPGLPVKQDLLVEADGDNLKVRNFAPRTAYDPKAPPLPSVPEARRYGIQPDRLWKP